MTLAPDFVAILACPVDHEPLLYIESERALYNPRLKRKYRIEDDIPILLIEEAELVDDKEHVRLLGLASDKSPQTEGEDS
ncbi:MAG: Trm112 family protein [Ferrimicrobium sp.]|uniref:Trm112 family protein n=1 Tax=Ferrimicrobium sp. TaxID=2926050 RepID=UPI002616B150|nr:Trm112 family protein [Ferrimicrobium sp.]